MKFKNKKKMKIIITTMSIGALATSGAFVTPIILKKTKENNKKEKENKEFKEIVIENIENEDVSKTKKDINISLNEIANNELIWKEFKNIINKNINFNKDEYSNSIFNKEKLLIDYKVTYFNKIKNLIYRIDKYEFQDGTIKIFGSLIKEDMKIEMPPFLINGFLTKKEKIIKKIEKINSNWVLQNIKIEKDIDKYSKIKKEEIKNSLKILFQDIEIDIIKFEINDFVINIKEGFISYEINLTAKENIQKFFVVKHENLIKDIEPEIKKINSLFLENNIFKFNERKNLIDYKYLIHNPSWRKKISEIPIVKDKKIVSGMKNIIPENIKGEIFFDVYFKKEGYKEHIVKMYYNNSIKDVGNLFDGLVEKIKSENRFIHLKTDPEIWFKEKEKQIKNYVLSRNKGWAFDFTYKGKNRRIGLFKITYDLKIILTMKKEYFYRKTYEFEFLDLAKELTNMEIVRLIFYLHD